AAMAPAAADTLASHFQIFSPDDYDYIYTGDLGIVGRDICNELIRGEGYNIDSKYKDCGEIIYSSEQDAHAGGSGCACSAVILAGHILDLLKNGDASRILFVGTGALLSPTSSLQGETIPSIAHAVCIER
ncbi:MAG TPA: stage V sporulation protein AD, partial [Clostridia bacterium]|nr:stage V sporulation protein AD [Clostridia bacterium]